MSELVTITEFANRLGVSKQAVSRAIERERIHKTPSGKIDYDSQSIAWEANRAVEKDHMSRGSSTGGNVKKDSKEYQEYLKINKALDAKLKELKIKEIEGQLISKQNLQKRYFPKLALIKSHLMSIPARHSHTLASLLIRHIEKISKSKVTRKVLDKIDPQQLARDIGEILDSDIRKLLKETEDARSP